MTNNEIWRELLDKQFHSAVDHSHSMWFDGYSKAVDHSYRMWFDGYSKADLELPKLENVAIPHWRLLPIVGKSDEPDFWFRLSRGIFNVNMNLRTEENLHYLEERDLFHDFFGHVPFLYDKEYTDFLIGLGIYYENSDKSEATAKRLSNIYWFTSEFGLIEEDGEICILGAGILSSSAETGFSLNKGKKMPFDLEKVANISSYVTNGFQEQYFVLEDKSQLKQIIQQL